MKIIKVTHSDDPAEHAKENVLSFIENRLKERPKRQYNRVVEVLSSVVKETIAMSLGTNEYKIISDDYDEVVYYRKLFKDVMEYVNSIENISLKQAHIRYPKTRNLAIGTYTLHPFDEKALCLLENFHGRLAQDKDTELIALLGKMGAKSVHIQVIEGDSSQFNAEMKIEYMGNEGGLNVGLDKQKQNDRELVVRYEGNQTEMPATLLEDSLWYKTDGELNGIFEARRYLQNQVKEYRYINTYTESFDFDFTFAAKYLNVASADIKAQYNAVKTKKRIFDIEFA